MVACAATQEMLKSKLSHRTAPFGLPCLAEDHLQSDSGAGLLLGKRCETKVGLDDLDLGEQLLGLGGLDAGVDNDVVTCCANFVSNVIFSIAYARISSL